MNKIILNLGFWSAIICLTSFVVWIISFVGIVMQSPLFYWTNIDDYIEYLNSNSQFFQYLAKSFMIVFSLAHIVLIVVFNEFVDAERQVLAKIAIAFTIMFAILSSVQYFTEVTAIRFAFAENKYAGLEAFLYANPTSVLAAVNMLGWTFFLGLSSLFMYLGLFSKPMMKWIRIGLLINAVSCIVAGVAYILQINFIVFLFINIGLGFGIMVFTSTASRYFVRIKHE